MPNNEDDILLQALQALGLLPEAITTAERAFQRALACIDSVEEDIRERNKEREKRAKNNKERARKLPMTLVSSLLRNQLETAKELGLDDDASDNTRTALAVCEVREVVRATKEEIAKEGLAPRRSRVKTNLELIADLGKRDGLADALEDPFVIEALKREIALDENSDHGWLDELGRRIREAANPAKKALQRRGVLITEGSPIYDRPLYYDPGGDGTAYSIDKLPLKQGFVMRCLALFGKYRPEIATDVPDRPFAKFTQKVWSLATGKEESLEKAMSNVFKAIRDNSASPPLLAALLDLPEKTLPPGQPARVDPTPRNKRQVGS